jgi:hypothetical protein
MTKHRRHRLSLRVVAMADDYRDIEQYILHSGAAPSIAILRQRFPQWRRQFLASGIRRVSISDALASNIMVLLIRDAVAKPDRAATHEHRNLLSRQGAEMLRERGWRD